MVTVITASGSPIQIPDAIDARLQDGKLVCLDAAGRRILTFDPGDVTAYAIETPGWDAYWVMGGPALVLAAQETSQGSVRLPWRLIGAPRRLAKGA